MSGCMAEVMFGLKKMGRIFEMWTKIETGDILGARKTLDITVCGKFRGTGRILREERIQVCVSM